MTTREFYHSKVPVCDLLDDYEEIEKYRNEFCNSHSKEAREHQNVVANMLKLYTTYNGLKSLYDVGSGKAFAAIRFEEHFKEQVVNTTKSSFMKEL